MNNNEFSFEEAIKRIEEIVDRLENDSVPLEEAIELYKEGTELSFLCREKLDVAQKEVMQLKRDKYGRPYVVEFNSSEDL